MAADTRPDTDTGDPGVSRLRTPSRKSAGSGNGATMAGAT